ncbi:hypothetical protein OWV82_014269 [Melia azedarach]|uniref:Uncharacterized protein n=1 Tax=Melia azedarach TaxID=155640 RepID=A0ACC1XK89_MELAZ|nr:hypothetical protein OWV82_014269 [Melia azedarach]
MAVESSVVVDVEPELDFDAENRTTSELISWLKCCFRDADFGKVESVLTAREAKLKQELDTVEKVNEWLKEKLDFSGMEKMTVENELKKYKREYRELQQLNSQLIKEKSIISEREIKAQKETEVWKRKYYGLVPRILKMEADFKSLSSVDRNARDSSENRNNVDVDNAFADTNVVEENVDLARANMGHQTGEDILSRNEMTSQRVANSDCSSQTGARLETGMLKRKQDSCLNVSENKNSRNVGFEDEDVNDNARTVDHNIPKVQKLIHGHDGSAANQCSKIALSSRSNSVEKYCTPPSEELRILRQREQKMGTEHASQNLMRELVPGIFDLDDSSSSSSSSYDTDDLMDMDSDLPKLLGNRNDKKWEFEKDMLAAFEKDNVLYLKAVCALYRQQTTVGKSPGSSSSTLRGFNHVNALRGTTLAKFLIDGDPQGRLKKSISELLQHDPKGFDDCKIIAVDHSKQLFEIYQKKKVPLFMF